jgi:hypothetical protein
MRRALALVPVALLLAACGDLDQIDVVRSGTATLPGVPGGAALPGDAIPPFPFSLGRDALAEQGVDPNDVDSARLVGLRLEVTQGTSLEDWLDEVSFYVEAPGLPRVLVASKTGIGALPDGTTAVELDAAGVDLKPYVLADTTAVTAEGAGTIPPVDTTLRATVTVRVDVNVSGLLD